MSAAITVTESAKQSLAEVQRYLADEIAPLMVAGAAEQIVRLDASCGAALVRNWLEAQLTDPKRAVTSSSYVYHAVKKFQHLGELGLVDRKVMDRYVAELSRLVVQLCPEREQPELRMRLSRIAEAPTKLSAATRLLNREVGRVEEGGAFGDLPSRRDEAAGDRRAASPRLSLLLGRIDEMRGTLAREPASEESQEILARMIAKAAAEAGDSAQLQEILAGLSDLGVEPSLDRKMFRLIGQRLPEWSVDTAAGAPGAPASGHLLRAMHQIVAMSPTREEGVERFGEMIYAAIDQLNDGHLAQAVAMLDVAQRLIEEKKVDEELSRIVKTRAQVSLAVGPLRQFSSAPAKHGLLRRVLWFFPAFSPESLLKRLDGEPQRETRKLLLSLLEVHGPPCRPLLLERLESYLQGRIPDHDGYYSRNVVFLLRRIPRRAEDDPTRELDLFRLFSGAERPFMVAKEAVAGLATFGLRQAETILIQRLGDFEQEALRGTQHYTFQEMVEILDRTCAALAGLESREAFRSVVRHADLRDPRLGETAARLESLAACDLSLDPDLTGVLLDRLRSSLPSRVLGVVIRRRAEETESLVRALSGTEDPRVKALFAEIAARYEGKPFAEAARAALARSRPDPAPKSSADDGISGDLELFGLPSLLQSLGDTSQSGRLRISEKNGHDRAVMVFREGKIVSCETGQLRGLDAVAQLIERQRPGTFRFEKVPPSEIPLQGPGMDVLATVLESIRRQDEFQEDRALVPEGAALMPGGAPPSLPDDEEDREFVKRVWREAARGTAPETCEEIVGADAYRVRRLYAHWLESGALRRRPAA